MSSCRPHRAGCGALVLLALLFVAPGARAQTENPWQRAIGPWAWLFPRDHGAHPKFQSEWWYFTGNLRETAPNAHGRPLGYQLTIFRQGAQFTPAQPDSRWAVRDFYFGHLTVSDIDANRFHFAERVSRNAFGEAHVTEGKMDIALGPWIIVQDGPHDAIRLVARDAAIALSLTCTPAKPLVLEGEAGLSRKADGIGEASYYYSYPRLATVGNVRVDKQIYEVSGTSWFDHEFSSSSLGANEVGWDWFCVQLNTNEEIMLYALRDKSGAIDPASEGTWINADGTSQRLPPGSFTLEKQATWTSPRSGAIYPAKWHVAIPARHADLVVTQAMADQELQLTKIGVLNYWEGACRIEGKIGSTSVQGTGYTELTGYAAPLKMGLKP